jgi:hypothetical protein
MATLKSNVFSGRRLLRKPGRKPFRRVKGLENKIKNLDGKCTKMCYTS